MATIRSTPCDRAERRRELLRDRARRFAQRTRQLKGHRDRQIAKRPAGRRFDGERRDLGQPELALNASGGRRPIRAVESEES